ncbi:hypothetical protein BsWGS_11647 [Bradybaena similaris]
MSHFQNLHQAKHYPATMNATPMVRYTWVCETVPNVATNNYVVTGYQQQEPTMYPFNVLHNSPVFASQQNFIQRPQTFNESFQTQNAFWDPSNAVFQSTPNLASPVTGYLVANPQFIHNSAGYQGEQLMTSTVDMANQMFSPGNVPSQPVPFDLVNAGHPLEQVWLQQQQQQQHQQLLQGNHQQHDHEQQEQTEAPIKLSSQTSLNENIINYATTHSSTEDAELKAEDSHVNENVSDIIQEPVKVAHTEQTPAAKSHLGGLADRRPNTLPTSFPTTLNPSLQIKSPSRLKEPVAVKKSDNDETISVSSYTVNEAQVRSQGEPKESEIQLRRKNSQKLLEKELYQKPRNKDECMRCNTKVYPMERTGPIKDVVYHKRCFTCASCGTTLNLKNFHHNPNDTDDLRVFCASHKPKERTNSCDASAVHIRSALTTPKLDKVNGQIRIDRHPSEVLARSGHTLTSASGQNTKQECFYYGMDAQETATFDTSLKSYAQDHSGKEDLLQVGDHHQYSQQGQVSDQFEQKSQLLNQEQRAPYEHHLQELVEHKIQLQQGILENGGTLADDVANITLSGNDKTPMEITNKQTDQTDEVFLPSAQINILTTDNLSKDKQFSTSSSGLQLLSSSGREEIIPGNGFEYDSTTHFKFDHHEVLQQQTQDMCNAEEDKKVITREPPSSQSSISTSPRSISPMHVNTSCSSLENDEGHSSSFSSDLSSRGRSSFSSDLSSPGSSSPGSELSNRQRKDPEAPGKPHSADQLALLKNGMRADRPSTHQYNSDLNTQRQAGPSVGMVEKGLSNYTLNQRQGTSKLDRFLPKNECMRLDRPSQYSSEAK